MAVGSAVALLGIFIIGLGIGKGSGVGRFPGLFISLGVYVIGNTDHTEKVEVVAIEAGQEMALPH